jgi:hypothetical protein
MQIRLLVHSSRGKHKQSKCRSLRPSISLKVNQKLTVGKRMGAVPPTSSAEKHWESQSSTGSLSSKEISNLIMLIEGPMLHLLDVLEI